MTHLEQYVARYVWTTKQGEILENIIREKGLSLEDFSKVFGKSKQYLHQLINGQINTISRESITLITSYFDVSLEYFFY